MSIDSAPPARSYITTVRLTPDELAVLRATARRLGLTLSSLLRMGALRQAEAPGK